MEQRKERSSCHARELELSDFILADEKTSVCVCVCVRERERERERESE